MDGLLVTSAHLRVLRQEHMVCVKGLEAWARSRGLSFEDFIQNGIPAEKLLATGDHMAIRLVEIAKEARDHG